LSHDAAPSTKSIGDQEMALLRFLAERGPVSVGEAAEEYGAPRDLARSTVLTMMERLRAKGHLEREVDGGVFRYRTAQPAAELMRGLVGQFVDRALGGSVSPFVSYLAEKGEVSASELSELERLVEQLQEKRRDA
jgi:predicted transcriptional regulator